MIPIFLFFYPYFLDIYNRMTFLLTHPRRNLSLSIEQTVGILTPQLLRRFTRKHKRLFFSVLYFLPFSLSIDIVFLAYFVIVMCRWIETESSTNQLAKRSQGSIDSSSFLGIPRGRKLEKQKLREYYCVLSICRCHLPNHRRRLSRPHPRAIPKKKRTATFHQKQKSDWWPTDLLLSASDRAQTKLSVVHARLSSSPPVDVPSCPRP